METRIDEIAPDIFRLSTYIEPIDLQFNQFLIRDEEPLLFHTGLNSIFPQVKEAVSRLIDPAKLRWISYSHFESDECGSINQWLQIADDALPVVGMLGAVVSLDDYAIRPARQLMDGETFSTGKKSFRYIRTPHLPHGWDAGMLFEETTATLLCSDLFHQYGVKPALAGPEVLEDYKKVFQAYKGTTFENYVPYTPQSEGLLAHLAALKPTTLAIMHGSSFSGDGEKLILELRENLKEIVQ